MHIESKDGAKNPKHLGEICFGKNLSNYGKLNYINLDWLIEAFQHTENKDEFFNDFFTKLAGTEKLRKQIEDGMSGEEIRDTWKPGLEEFKERRKPYLLYE